MVADRRIPPGLEPAGLADADRLQRLAGPPAPGPARPEDGRELDALPAARAATETPDPETAELAAAALSVLDELPDHTRLAALLRIGEGLGFPEIAETLGVSEETARWHLFKARAHLARRLGEGARPR